MGLRGKKPDEGMAERDKLIWRTYLLLRVLGYDYPEGIMTVVAARTGLSCHMVHNSLNYTKPDGCYDCKRGKGNSGGRHAATNRRGARNKPAKVQVEAGRRGTKRKARGGPGGNASAVGGAGG